MTTTTLILQFLIPLVQLATMPQLIALLKYTGFKVAEIKDVAVHVCAKVSNRDGTTTSGVPRPLHAVARKYESERFSRASVAYQLPRPDFLKSLQG